MSAKPKKTDGNGGRDSNGKFVRGNSGKPKGAANHTTKAMRKMLLDFLHNKFDEVCGLWDELETRDKLTLYLQLSRLVIPKPETEYEESTEKNELHIIRTIIPQRGDSFAPPIAWVDSEGNQKYNIPIAAWVGDEVKNIPPWMEEAKEKAKGSDTQNQ